MTDWHFRNSIIQGMLISLQPVSLSVYCMIKFGLQIIPTICFWWEMLGFKEENQLKWNLLIICLVLLPNFFKVKNGLLHNCNKWLSFTSKGYFGIIWFLLLFKKHTATICTKLAHTIFQEWAAAVIESQGRKAGPYSAMTPLPPWPWTGHLISHSWSGPKSLILSVFIVVIKHIMLYFWQAVLQWLGKNVSEYFIDIIYL